MRRTQKKKKSQVDLVLEYLVKMDMEITPAKAELMFGITRLADVIFKIKKRGLVPDGKKLGSRRATDGFGGQYAAYRLIDE